MGKLRLRFPSVIFPSEVTFGKGSIKELYSNPLGETILVATSNKKVHDYVDISPWREAGRAYICKRGKEPDKEVIQDLSVFFREYHPKTVIALGGGSVIDLARLVWDEIKHRGDNAGNPPKWIFVPTIHGSGAEATSAAVYCNGERKIAKVSEDFRAHQVILDSNFLSSVSLVQKEIQSCDILSHAIEAYHSILPAFLSEEFSVYAIKILYEIDQKERDMGDADQDLLFKASFFAGLAVSNRSTGMVHAFAHSVASLGIPHAVSIGLALSAAVKFLKEKALLVSELWKGASISSFDDFYEFISRKTRLSIKANNYSSLINQVLTNDKKRLEFSDKVANDMCMRTNCCRLNAEEMDRYLDYILKDIDRYA